LIFSTTVVSTFLSLRRIKQDMIRNVYLLPCEVPGYPCPILIKLEFSWQIFEE